MINPNAYYTVQAWMVNDLGLHGNELALYAIIYGFSQDGRSEFAGSISYIEEWLGCTRKTAIKTIAGLVEKGLIKKRISKNGVDPNAYKAVLEHGNWERQSSVNITPVVVENLPQGSVNITPGVVENLPQGSVNITPNNNIYNNSCNYSNKDIYKGDAAATPPTDEPEKKTKGQKPPKPPKPPKQEYGEYKHVMLTAEEHTKLVKKHGEEKAAALIKYLDEYIEERPKYKSESHYLAIGRWVVDAVNEKARRNSQTNQTRPAGYGYGRPAGPVGPNGIPIDPRKNDLDEFFR